MRGDAPVPLLKGGKVPALYPAPPPLARAGVSKLLVASWSGTLTGKGSGDSPTGEWSGWQGPFVVGPEVYLGVGTVSSIGWLQVRFGQSFNRGSPEVQLVRGTYQTVPWRGLVTGSTDEPFRMRITRPTEAASHAHWSGGAAADSTSRSEAQISR